MDDTQRSKIRLGFAACALGQAIWGCSFLFSELALEVTGPVHLLALRFDITVLFMLFLCFIKQGELHFIKKRGYWREVVLYMVLQPIYYLCETYGLFYTNSVFAGVFLAMIPLFSSIMAAIFLKEYPSRRKILYSVIPIVGVVVITLAGKSIGIVTALGVIFLFLTCVSGGAIRTMNVGTSGYISPFERTFLVMISGAVCYTAVVLKDLGGSIPAFVSPMKELKFALPVIALVLFCSFAANMLVNYSAKYTTVLQMSAFANLNPLCSVLCGVLILGEPMTLTIFLGCALILPGIWLIIKPE